MTDRRIVVEHKDGRRISVFESDFEDETKNPFNFATQIHEFDGNTGATILRQQAAKPMDDWKSLKKEGFKPVAYIHEVECTRDCTHDKDVTVHEGNEIALEEGK